MSYLFPPLRPRFVLPALPSDAPTAAEIAAIDAVNATPVDERALRRAWREAKKAETRLALCGHLWSAGVATSVLRSLTTEELESAYLSEFWEEAA